MDDLNERLAEILEDEESMKKVRLMAESLLGGEETEKEENGNIADSETVSKIMRLITKFNSQKDDNRTALLLALKPHLNPERQKKVTTAVKLLKLIEILPELKDSGIFDL